MYQILVGIQLASVEAIGAHTFAYDFGECQAKFLGEQGIDERIDGRIAVAQPEENGEQQWLNAGWTECAYQVHGEKWCPAQNEAAHNDGQRLGRLRFHAKTFRLHFQYAFADAAYGFAAAGNSTSGDDASVCRLPIQRLVWLRLAAQKRLHVLLAIQRDLHHVQNGTFGGELNGCRLVRLQLIGAVLLQVTRTSIERRAVDALRCFQMIIREWWRYAWHTVRTTATVYAQC